MKQQPPLLSLESEFPNRPIECTRTRIKPFICACDCEWCKTVDETWLLNEENAHAGRNT